jgi:hypothetical protein
MTAFVFIYLFFFSSSIYHLTLLVCCAIGIQIKGQKETERLFRSKGCREIGTQGSEDPNDHMSHWQIVGSSHEEQKPSNKRGKSPLGFDFQCEYNP